MQTKKSKVTLVIQAFAVTAEEVQIVPLKDNQIRVRIQVQLIHKKDK